MRKLLILLGAARYPENSDLALAAFAPTHAAFLAAMTGGPIPIVANEDVLDLFDTDFSWPTQQVTIDRWLKDKAPDDGEQPRALMVYYVGHGGIADDGSQFFMAINSTNRIDPLASSISRTSFSVTLERSARRFRRYLLIDCCFAANVLKGMQAPIQDKMAIELKVLKDNSTGLAAICSSDSISTSNGDGLGGLTQFTDALVETILGGDPEAGDELTFENLRDLLERTLADRYPGKAVPPSSDFKDDVHGRIDRLPLIPNRAERPRALFVPRTGGWLPRARAAADIRLQAAAGLPGHSASSEDGVLVRRAQYAAAFDGPRGRPRWVSWHLRAEDLGDAPRSDRWLDDPKLPPGATAARMEMFVHSGYDRGCLCPSGNRSASAEDRRAVTMLTNVVAQSSRRNRDFWAGFEAFCAQLVKANAVDLYIAAGPIGTMQTIGGSIEVPASLWKVVLIVPEGEVPGAALELADVVAIRMSNAADAAIVDWTDSITTVSAIEDDTGLRFFSELAPPMREVLRRRRTNAMADLVEHLTGGKPPLGIGAVRIVAAAAKTPLVSERDQRLFDRLRACARNVGKAFAAHPKTGVPPATLQKLARPIEEAGAQLTNLAIVDELLDSRGAERNAGVFAGAVIVHDRKEYDWFDKLVGIAADGKTLRGAPMWRVLRAIKRLAGQVEVTGERRAALVAALANCALSYDTTYGRRFETRDIVLMVAQIAKLGRLKIDLGTDGIFSAGQLEDWARLRAKAYTNPRLNLVSKLIIEDDKSRSPPFNSGTELSNNDLRFLLSMEDGENRLPEQFQKISDTRFEYEYEDGRKGPVARERLERLLSFEFVERVGGSEFRISDQGKHVLHGIKASPGSYEPVLRNLLSNNRRSGGAVTGSRSAIE